MQCRSEGTLGKNGQSLIKTIQIFDFPSGLEDWERQCTVLPANGVGRQSLRTQYEITFVCLKTVNYCLFWMLGWNDCRLSLMITVSHGPPSIQWTGIVITNIKFNLIIYTLICNVLMVRCEPITDQSRYYIFVCTLSNRLIVSNDSLWLPCEIYILFILLKIVIESKYNHPNFCKIVWTFLNFLQEQCPHFYFSNVCFLKRTLNFSAALFYPIELWFPR